MEQAAPCCRAERVLYTPAMGENQRRQFRIDGFVVDCAARRLLRDDYDVGADAQQVGVLMHLAERWPGIVDKHSLIEQVWGGHYVTDAALHKTISTLRRQLRELGVENDWIHTRHRLGYQLAVEPQWLDAALTTAFDPVTHAAAAQASIDESTAHNRHSRFWAALAVCAAVGALTAAGFWTFGTQYDIAPDTASTDASEPGISTPALDAQIASLGLDELLRVAVEARSSDPALAGAAAHRLLTGAEAEGRRDMVGMAHKQLGLLAYFRGEAQPALDHYDEALAAFMAVDDRLEQANILHNVAVAYSDLGGDRQRGVAAAQQALQLRLSLDDPLLLARTRLTLATLHRQLLDYASAQEQLDAVLRAAELDDNIELQVGTRLQRGDLAIQRSEDPLPDFDLAWRLAVRHGRPALAAAAGQRLSKLYAGQGDFEQARDRLRQARQQLLASGNHSQLPVLTYNDAGLAERVGDLGQAIDLYRQVLREAPEDRPSSLRVSAWLAIDRLGSPDDSGAARQAAYREAVLLNEPPSLVQALLSQGRALLAEGNTVAARAALIQARGIPGLKPAVELETELLRFGVWIDLIEGDFDGAERQLDTLTAYLRQEQRGDDAGGILSDTLSRARAGHSDVAQAFIAESYPRARARAGHTPSGVLADTPQAVDDKRITSR